MITFMNRPRFRVALLDAMVECRAPELEGAWRDIERAASQVLLATNDTRAGDAVVRHCVEEARREAVILVCEGHDYRTGKFIPHYERMITALDCANEKGG